MNYYLKALRNYAVFTGRARRNEYWYFVLFNILISFALTAIDYMVGTFNAETGSGLLSSLYGLAVLLPGIAVSVRRLHDTERSGWWFLLVFLPCIGPFILLYFFLQDGTAGPNEFGSDPKASGD